MPGSSQKPKLLDRLKADYLKSQIESGDPSRAKKALQEICKLYRSGFFVRHEQLFGLEQSIIGLLYTQRKDEKVRRWALNALARLGRENTCIDAVKHVLRDFGQEPQTMASAIAATYRMSRKASQILRDVDFDPQMATLAALQHVKQKDLDLTPLPLNIETASPDHLQLALVVVGLDRAPPNLLNPRHTNAEMVKALGAHHDDTVSQYSVWAITENPTLGVRDLGVDIRDVEQQPPNVRAWIFRLLAMTPCNAQKHLEYIALGTSDPEVEARIGLATGLRDTFFDGLEETVMDWFMKEFDAEVVQLLMDHMIRQAPRCGLYRSFVLEFYQDNATELSWRRRMMANAAGTVLYGEMRRIDAVGQDDLFKGGLNVTNNTFNISGGIQGGAVSLGSKAENSGTTSIHYNPQTVATIQSELSKAEHELHSLILEPALKREALEHIQSAKADPSPDKIQRVVGVLEKVKSLATSVHGAGTAIGAIVTALGRATGLM